MEQIFHSVFSTFNVEWQYLAWYLVMFAIVLFVLWRYALGPVMRTIETRQREINDSLDRAEEAAKSVDSSRARAEELLHDASTQAQEILRRAEQAGTQIQERARTEARTEAEAIARRARDEIARERAAAVQEIRAQTVDLALLAASRVIEANLDVDRNRRLVEETIRSAELVAPLDGARGGRHG